MIPDETKIADALRRLSHQITVTVPTPPTCSPRRRWVAPVLAISTVIIAAMVTASIVINRDRPRLVVPADSTGASLPQRDAASHVTAPPTSATLGTTIDPTTTVTEQPLTRPVITLDGCTASWARGPATSDSPYHSYAHGADASSVQIFAGPSRSLRDPYVVVQRFFAGQALARSGEDDINGSAASVAVNGKGGGGATWLLADGSAVYVRDHLFDKDQLLAIARALVPRPADAVVPGFDFATPSPFGLALLDETADPLKSDSSASSGCLSASGAQLQSSLLRGRPVFLFTVYLDQPAPYPPVASLADGAMLMVRGRPDGLDAEVALRSIRQAPAGEWADLLMMPSSDEALSSISLPTDPLVFDQFADRHFATYADLHQAAVDAVRAVPAPDDGSDLSVSNVSNVSDVSGGPGEAIIVTEIKPVGPVAAAVWVIHYSGAEPDVIVDSVNVGIRCRDGYLRDPAYSCAE
jgi:hypothetical protein